MSPTGAKVPQAARDITISLATSFKANLHAVLLYGSSQYKEEYWDLDILVVLKEKSTLIPEFDTLKRIAEEFNKHSLDLQVLYLAELQNPNTFALDAHGPFFSRILKRAAALYGVNPFTEAYEPTREIFLISLITRIQRYVFHARQEYILSGRFNKDKNPKYHQKHILRAMFDVLLMSKDWLEPEDVRRLFSARFPKVLTVEDWEKLETQSDDIEDYILIYEKVYSVALLEVKNLLST